MIAFENRRVRCEDNVLVGRFKYSASLLGTALLSLVPKTTVFCSRDWMPQRMMGWDGRKEKRMIRRFNGVLEKLLELTGE